ncbi:hypothetical protein [Nonomuraea endophytica]|uniref:hypothetical protein n=1 Tax=Nonomuraea endophytica TaxID=714136 RepID=UPI0037CBEFAE
MFERLMQAMIAEARAQVDLDAERCINRIKLWSGLAFRFGKTPDSYLEGLHLRRTILWIRSLRPA